MPKKPKVPPLVSMRTQGERIGALRAALKWSNRTLSEKTGVPEPTLSMYIHAKKESISTFDMWRIARGTGVTTDWLIYGDRRGLTTEMRTLLPDPDSKA